MAGRHEADATAAPPTRAWILHPDLGTRGASRSPEHALAEAMALARALPALEVAGGEVVRLREPHPGQLFGTGKADEVAAHLREGAITLVLVDGPLSPIQQRNLEKLWGVKVLDRTGLILEIFADRARTREGVLQVELAALAYQRTRLVRAWTHLERQRGGYGFVGGPGETQLESDRRAIDDQIVRLRRQLAQVARTRQLHRAARARVPWPVVALVGYTNAGKSTLFNRLTGAEVLVEDMLFATLDPTLRAIRLPDVAGRAGGRRVMLSDTVGFISNLPHELVAAFRATLEEVLEADLILHVRDLADPETEAQRRDVVQILESLGVDEAVERIEVWNKIDQLDPEARAGALARAARHPEVVAVSALTGEGVPALVAAIAEGVARAEGEVREDARLLLGFAEGRRRAWLHEAGVVLDEAETPEGWRLHLRWTPRQRADFEALPAAGPESDAAPGPDGDGDGDAGPGGGSPA